MEIWLTSEDTGTYGRDIGSSLPELLWAIIEKLRRGVRLRLGMTNPPYIREHLPEMVKVLNHPQVYKFLHIPVQAASDEVLENMKRKYTIAEFCEVRDMRSMSRSVLLVCFPPCVFSSHSNCICVWCVCACVFFSLFLGTFLETSIFLDRSAIISWSASRD